jgi:hypothetical protein
VALQPAVREKVACGSSRQLEARRAGLGEAQERGGAVGGRNWSGTQ